MDLGTVLSVAQTLFAALQCQELRDVCSFLGYESELENLARTVNTVRTVLQEAEIMQMQAELPPQAQLYIDEIKDAVYDADDLLDEFVTLAERKKLTKGGKISEKVRLLLSSFNPHATAQRMFRRVKEIRKRLDDIANDHTKFGFKFESKPILRRREETCSYVYAQDIIGREDDIDKILHKLLDPGVKRDVSCLAIVGIGGLGKTALAQLVYNHPMTEENFPLRLWACVADQDIRDLDVDDTLRKILHSATGENHDHLSMDHVQRQLQEKLAGKKFFLVLDDIWNEDRNQWLSLMGFLRGGPKGSWVLVTTRSSMTATIVGGEMHELKGLSEDDSWLLFEKTAFGEDQDQTTRLELVQIGQEIVKQCANVPLAIRVVGTALYGQDKRKWLSFQELGLGRIKEAAKSIKPLLKLSYLHLEPQLKICFSYCALFPRDHGIMKEQLLNLWMAQDYIVPEEGQSLQDASEEYFSILVRRCFFQDVIKDEYGKIIACKTHDLMHDIAQEVAGKEICATNSFTTNLDNKIRHFSYMSIDEGIQMSFTRNKIRTCLRIAYGKQYIPLDKLLKNWMCLRVLDMSDSRIKSLPSGLEKLLHLRDLYLSLNYDLEILPNSITKLHNLQTLILQGCHRLRELPKNLPKLVKLRVLDMGIHPLCCDINSMPRGMGKLSSLQQLPLFVVGDNNSTTKQSIVEQMEELKALTDLKGNLQIRILKNTKYNVDNAEERGYIKNKQHLSRVGIEFHWQVEEHNRIRDDEEGLLLEDLQPHPKLRELDFLRYKGSRMPSWAREDKLAISLPNLVKVSFVGCLALQHLPSLRKFRYLKVLWLDSLNDLEYIENTWRANISDSAGTSNPDTFFPSLEKLWLSGMPELKGWWRDDEINNSNGEHGRRFLPSFPHLIWLAINGCPNLTRIPPCPTLEELELQGEINENLGIMITSESGNSKLRSLKTRNVRYLKSILPVEGFQRLKQMEIYLDDKVENLSEVGEVFRSCSSSLKSLEIWSCRKLKSLCGALEHLTVLESLELKRMPNLSLSNKEEGLDDDGKPWQYLHQSLRFLKLVELPELLSLPKGMQYLTALQSLYIIDCKRLESLPESMTKLTSLKRLEIRACSVELNERCREPTGEDWPKIQHVPDIIRD